jgi:cysteine-S-conjugate beta-lyase
MSAERALVVSSGMGALDVITRLLKPGDEVVTGDDLYGGTNRLLTYLATNGGIIVHHVDTTTPSAVASALSSKTAMLLLETPTNPLIKIVDIPTLATMAHTANPNAIVAVDNTMLSPLLQNPLELGADIVYESGTKYLSGHHDLMAGVIAVNNSAIGDKLYFTINSTGCGLSPFDSWLLLRGVKTLKVRMDTQQANAQRIAEFLEEHGFRVRYPGLKSHPQHALHASMARGAGAVLSFETGSVSVSEKVVEAARLWAISVSFGCVNSLISMPCRMSHASIDPETRRKREFPEDLIRLCVGIEDVDDLIDDLSRAVSFISPKKKKKKKKKLCFFFFEQFSNIRVIACSSRRCKSWVEWIQSSCSRRDYRVFESQSRDCHRCCYRRDPWRRCSDSFEMNHTHHHHHHKKGKGGR